MDSEWVMLCVRRMSIQQLNLLFETAPYLLSISIIIPLSIQLALKHRLNKNHKTRIVAFVASPITDDTKEVKQIE